MRLVVFGSTGATGCHIVDQALAGGHEVTAFVRSASSLARNDARLRVIEGDVTDAPRVLKAIRGQDAVLSALGAKGKVRICAPGMANILAAMDKTGVRRLVAMSSFGASESRDGSFYTKVLRLALKDRMEDKDEMERLIRASNIDWTIVRAPALTNGKTTGHYRLGADIRIHLWSSISRGNVAHFMLRALETSDFTRQAPTIVSALH